MKDIIKVKVIVMIVAQNVDKVNRNLNSDIDKRIRDHNMRFSQRIIMISSNFRILELALIGPNHVSYSVYVRNPF